MAIKIFVEGIADKKFLQDYIQTVYKSNVEFSIEETKGWSHIKSKKEKISNSMEINSNTGGINIIIFDSDSSFLSRKQELEQWKQETKADFQLFLWPNNMDNGDLETVLENIINKDNKEIFECWDKYEECISKLSIPYRKTPLTIPARKTKIFGYCEVLHGKSNTQKEKAKERNRDYTKTEFWNLDSTYLNPLKGFLDLFFINTDSENYASEPD